MAAPGARLREARSPPAPQPARTSAGPDFERKTFMLLKCRFWRRRYFAVPFHNQMPTETTSPPRFLCPKAREPSAHHHHPPPASKGNLEDCERRLLCRLLCRFSAGSLQFLCRFPCRFLCRFSAGSSAAPAAPERLQRPRDERGSGFERDTYIFMEFWF